MVTAEVPVLCIRIASKPAPPREPEECNHALEDELEPGQGNEEPAEIAKDSARERDQRLRERSSGHQ
ncbi:MAG: hypothetical protein ACXWOV_05350 [Isosphaeraceae bacterium]